MSTARPPLDQLVHASEDAAVRIEREVVAGELLLRGFVEVRVFEQDGAEDGAFGVRAGGHAALERDVWKGSHGSFLWCSIRATNSITLTALQCRDFLVTRLISEAYREDGEGSRDYKRLIFNLYHL